MSLWIKNWVELLIRSFAPVLIKVCEVKWMRNSGGLSYSRCQVSLVDGKTHPVDSKDIAFQIAGREVFKKAFESASPILLEPVVNLSVTVPEEATGDIMGDLSSRRGKIGGMNPSGKKADHHCKGAEAEVQNYSTTLRSLTQGRGFFTNRSPIRTGSF
jgi:elongation factor G